MLFFVMVRNTSVLAPLLLVTHLVNFVCIELRKLIIFIAFLIQIQRKFSVLPAVNK